MHMQQKNYTTQKKKKKKKPMNGKDGSINNENSHHRLTVYQAAKDTRACQRDLREKKPGERPPG